MIPEIRDQLDAAFAIVGNQAPGQFVLVQEKPLKEEMPHLRVAWIAAQARFADDIFEDFKFIESIADKQHIFLSEKEVEKSEDVVLRYIAAGKAVVGVVSDVML